jgi:ribonucleoside-diphosphate reductase alpha chain
MSNLCVSGDTKIEILLDIVDWTELEIEIKDLQNYIDVYPNLQVLSYDVENNQTEWKKITAFAQTSPEAEVMKITDEKSGKSIVVTPDHKVFTKNRGYVMSKELTVYDKLVICHNDQDDSRLKIEYLEDKIPVYDITVEGTHNFFANGILVSNCMEILLRTEPINHIDDDLGKIALCILSCINVGIVKSDKELEELCDISVRFLDELIDHQQYPVKAAEITTRGSRSLGIGVIGLAHYLAKLGYKYSDPEAWSAVHGLSESLQYYLLKASNQLAKEKGACDHFSITKYSRGILPIDTYKKQIDEICNDEYQHDWEELRNDIMNYGLRHTTLTAQPPTESSSVVCNATNGIEPPRDYLSIKQSKKGTLKQIVPQYNKLKNYYTLLWEMESNEGYINIVAMMQKFFDQAISANWSYNPEKYPNKEVPISVIVNDFLSCYSKGHKTAYYHNTYDGKTDDVSAEKVNNLDELISDLLQSPQEDCDACNV